MPSQLSSAPPTKSLTRGMRTLGLLRLFVIVLLAVSTLLTTAYALLSLYIASRLIYEPQKPIERTPGDFGLTYRDITFPSREDHLLIRGWFIPGVLPNGSLTSQRTIVMVHGVRGNREDKGNGMLKLSVELARHGFAVLSFDMRGSGESPPAPLSLGYFEQRDVLGAVDFLRTGPLAYPQLGRPRKIGGWGISMGGATLLFAAEHEPQIQAVVSDCAYADIIPILEREVPKGSNLPQLFTPGALTAAWALYGIDYYAVRPVDVVAHLAPRPLLLIHGQQDSYIPPSHMDMLAAAARRAPNAHVKTWLVPGATHAQSFQTHEKLYVSRIVSFYTDALGPALSTSSSQQ